MIKSGSSQSKRQREEINPEDCAFYGQFDKGSKGTREFFEIYPALQEKGQIIISSDNFILIPDIAPITADHLLVVPKNHFRSFASLPKSFNEEVEQIVSEAVNKMEKFHPNSEVVAFEHGMGTIDDQIIMCGGCGRTEHAHLHILPIPKGKDENVGKKLKQTISQYLTGIKSLPLPKLDISTLTGKFPYLYLWSSIMDSSLVFIQDSLKITIPSQLIRKLIATEVLKIDEKGNRWDWREYIIFNAKQGEKTLLNTLNRWGTKEL
ncbi:MAG: hypothetical protein A3B74_03515 [Candidatus Kerfeldbacteria bacterium RIFCSPHIGHO2_02_FULL_42_14]|uniref:HIT domain-containing protein n=1 Tax=Candidatus Kerfeldbacteria bacterium RIFCSPHIGHO2_02_FULL_42_14 TaxID=1798540 RepID=A0A1G2APU8_9BACT|nr:MAG: hypothetical protein A3B74_03515 [Candidatus Kerfeldbacteria bacterium RIFCSPHIGHO2_02_FULL_42_14]OGY80584.1 MAG: hypothetical protein A3E60_04005 [Candidatus Kerfeldbacteria bacterium RIFCSPHIGHO2_12_FULL_42_13]OGY87570.1 MAG: hypothetical protein A3G01_00935 [Candidatus Kerfeldbacteria bacterium RIFCSPLOWO2_12_FULL_43_9]